MFSSTKFPKFRLLPEKDPQDLEFQDVRHRVGDTLARRLSDGYQLGVQTLQEFKLDDDSGATFIPTFKEVMDGFTQAELGLLKDYQKPTILIRPPHTVYEDIKRALISHGYGAQDGLIVRSFSQRPSDSQVSSTEYRTFITEAACRINILSRDKETFTLPFVLRIGCWNSTRSPGECGMTSDLYLLLAMQSIVREQLIDERMFTILDGEPIVSDSYIPAGQCLNRQPSINWLMADDETSARGRFRRVLRGSRR